MKQFLCEAGCATVINTGQPRVVNAVQARAVNAGEASVVNASQARVVNAGHARVVNAAGCHHFSGRVIRRRPGPRVTSDRAGVITTAR